MRTSNLLRRSLLIAGIVWSMAQSSRADALDVGAGQTVQLGLPGIVTNYSYTSVTVEAGGTLQISGSVTLSVTSNVLIDGSMMGGGNGFGAQGTNGAAGDDGVVVGDVAEDGDPGQNGSNGKDAVVDAPSLLILARNMIVNGSILFNPQGNGGGGGDGGDAGTGADSIANFSAGWGGPGGAGGNGGGSLGAPYLYISVIARGGSLPSAGKFIMGTNAVISLDNMGGGGGGGKGGKGGMGGNGGNATMPAGPGGAGGQGGPSGIGGSGGFGGSGGNLVIIGMGIDLEGKISLTGSDGGDGGELGAPKDGGNGGNGMPNNGPGPGGRGGNAGDAGDAFLSENLGGGGGNGGFGGNLYVTVSAAFTNFAAMDFSAGQGGKGGAGQEEGAAKPGTPGTGGGGAANGQAGQPSAEIGNGTHGIAGANGAMVVNNAAWGTNMPNGWQTIGDGVLVFSVTNKTNTVILTSTNGPFAVAGQLGDPRLQYDPGLGEAVVESNEPVELRFAYQWLSTNGSVDVLLDGKVVAHLVAPAVLGGGFSEDSVILPGLRATVTDTLDLTFQLNTTGAAQFQLGSFSLEAEPLLPFLSVGLSQTNAAVLSLSWFGATNENYQVQYRDSASSGAWINLGAAMPGQGGSATLPVTVTAGDAARFYRLVMTPGN